MASKKVSEFPVTASIANSDVFLMNHLGTTSTVSFSTLSSSIAPSTGSVAALNFIEKPASSTNGQVLTYNGSTSTWVASAAPAITSGIAVSATGTSVNFTGIPNWVKRVTVMFSNVTLNGSELSIRVGSGSIDSTSTYAGYAVRQGVTVPCNYYSNANTTSLQLTYGLGSNETYSGLATLCLVGLNVWVFNSYISSSYSYANNNSAAGRKDLLGTLNQIRIGSHDNTAVFTSGTINIMWE
jgi:hypothetical protein